MDSWSSTAVNSLGWLWPWYSLQLSAGSSLIHFLCYHHNTKISSSCWTIEPISVTWRWDVIWLILTRVHFRRQEGVNSIQTIFWGYGRAVKKRILKHNKNKNKLAVVTYCWELSNIPVDLCIRPGVLNIVYRYLRVWKECHITCPTHTANTKYLVSLLSVWHVGFLCWFHLKKML